MMPSLGLCASDHGLDDGPAPEFGVLFKTDSAVNQGEQSMVFADAHVVALANDRATLPHNDTAGGHNLASETFDA